MRKSVTDLFASGLIRLMGLGAVASLIVYGAYIFNFGPEHWFKPSGDPADWGVFGDFVGGLLNPFFSFLAFIGVVFTVMLQSRQLDVIRQQADHEEIQRVLSTLSTRIDGLLASTPAANLEVVGLVRTEPISLFEQITAIASFYSKRPLDGDSALNDWQTSEKLMSKLSQVTKREAALLCLEIEALAWCLIRYRNEGGSDTVTGFYQYRYNMISRCLHSLRLTENHLQLQSFFDLD